MPSPSHVVPLFQTNLREGALGKMYLFYSNRRPEDAAFLDELERIELDNPNYKFIGTMTQMQKSRLPWRDETGSITRQMLTKWILWE